MTIGDWLASRTPAPPPALRQRVNVALGDALSRDAGDAPECLLRAGEQLAAALLQGGSTSRDSALDLLAADALVTYAFEAASERPLEIADRAVQAMSRIGSLGATVPEAAAT